MINFEFIGIGVLLVIMGALFSLFGQAGTLISFIIAITVVIILIKKVKEQKVAIN